MSRYFDEQLKNTTTYFQRIIVVYYKSKQIRHTNLRWKRGFFSNLYTIYSQEQLIGKLKDRPFSQTAIGELSGKVYTFRTKGIFKQHIVIIDNLENRLIGEITFNSWMTKAIISVNGKKINWKYDNLWNTKWSISDSEEINIKYSGSSTNEQIDSNVNDSLLVLIGLFVTNYYRQMSMVVFILIFIPVCTTVLNWKSKSLQSSRRNKSKLILTY